MEHDYLQSKKFKKKKAKNGVWIIVVLGILFVFTLLKFAGGGGGIGSIISIGPPTSGEVYDVAKQYVKATTPASSIDFPESGYEFAKKTDSIYVVRSVVETTSQNGEKRKLNFKAVLQFKGGRHDNMSNWALLNITEDQ